MFQSDYCDMIRIGVLGYDPILPICLQLIQELPGFEAVQGYSELSIEISLIEQCGLYCAQSTQDLFHQSDIILFLSKERQQLRLVEKAIKYHKHIYLYQFNQFQTDYMHHLNNLCQETGVATMVHLAWMHHPITYGILPHLTQPQRIEVNFEGLLDMEHDSLVEYSTLLNLSMLLYSLNNSHNSRTSIQRITVAEQNSEALNIRFEYPHGCVADIMLDSVIDSNNKELKIYQKHTYLQANYSNSELRLHYIEPRNKNIIKSKTAIQAVNIEKPTINIQQLPSLTQFLLSVQNHENMPLGSIPDLYNAMRVTDRLKEKIALSEMFVQ